MDGLRMEAAYSAVLGKILAEARKSKGVRQKDLAAVVGVGAPTWSKIENGESTLSVNQLAAACLALDTVPSKVLELVESAMETLPKSGIAVAAPRQAMMPLQGTGIAVAGVVGAGLAVGLCAPVTPIAVTGAVLGRIIASTIAISSLWRGK